MLHKTNGMKFSISSLSFWGMLCCTMLLNTVIFDVRLILSDDSVKALFIPDDGYYYLSLAKNFSIFHHWTFDSGVSATSGFHPLFAYALAGAYALFKPTLYGFVSAGMLITALICLASAFYFWYKALRAKQVERLQMLTILFGAHVFAVNSVSLTEWSLALFFSMMLTRMIFDEAENRKRHSLVLFFILGCFGTISRSDFGIFSTALLLYSAFIYSGENKKRIRSLAFFTELGALAGVAIVSVHSFLITGDFIQSSVRMKSFWQQVPDPAISPLGNMKDLLYKTAGLESLKYVLLGGVFLLSAYALYKKYTGQKKTGISFSGILAEMRHSVLLLFFGTGVIACIGMYVLYGNMGGIPTWYTSNAFPAILFIGVAITGLVHSVPNDKIFNALKIAVTAVIIANCALNIKKTQRLDADSSYWRWQTTMYQVGVYLREHPQDGRIGSWNAGVINYYQGGSVINLDGLVNADILPYAKNNALVEYMKAKDIRYIVDFEKMFSDTLLQKKGGYYKSGLEERLQPLKQFSTEDNSWGHHTLYKVMISGETNGKESQQN